MTRARAQPGLRRGCLHGAVLVLHKTWLNISYAAFGFATSPTSLRFGVFFPSLYILGVCKEASVFPRRLLLHLHVKCGVFNIRCRGCFPWSGHPRQVPAPRWRGWLGAGAAVAPRRNAASVNKARPSACCLYLISTLGNFLWGCWTNRREMNHETATSP